MSRNNFALGFREPTTDGQRPRSKPEPGGLPIRIERIAELKDSPDPQTRDLWNCPQIITCESGAVIRLGRRHIDGLVFVVGDYLIETALGWRVFQLYQITDPPALPRLANGLYISRSELARGNPVAERGDYLVRKRDGYYLIRLLLFERENEAILDAIRWPEKQKATQKRQGVSPEVSSGHF